MFTWLKHGGWLSLRTDTYKNELKSLWYSPAAWITNKLYTTVWINGENQLKMGIRVENGENEFLLLRPLRCTLREEFMCKFISSLLIRYPLSHGADFQKIREDSRLKCVSFIIVKYYKLTYTVIAAYASTTRK